MVRSFIQARMDSSRFPGKVLAPLGGRPVIAWVIDGVKRALPQEHIIVATSDKTSDDPLACYVQQLGVMVFRGSLDDVFARFCQCLEENPCAWFFRVSADSPLLNSRIMTLMASRIDPRLDLITNVQKRTFPHGHSMELLNAATFVGIDPARLSLDDHEHVTSFYYTHSEEFRILNVENTDPAYGELNFVVDTLEDLRRAENMMRNSPFDFVPEVAITEK